MGPASRQPLLGALPSGDLSHKVLWTQDRALILIPEMEHSMWLSHAEGPDSQSEPEWPPSLIPFRAL